MSDVSSDEEEDDFCDARRFAKLSEFCGSLSGPPLGSRRQADDFCERLVGGQELYKDFKAEVEAEMREVCERIVSDRDVRVSLARFKAIQSLRGSREGRRQAKSEFTVSRQRAVDLCKEALAKARLTLGATLQAKAMKLFGSLVPRRIPPSDFSLGELDHRHFRNAQDSKLLSSAAAKVLERGERMAEDFHLRTTTLLYQVDASVAPDDREMLPDPLGVGQAMEMMRTLRTFSGAVEGLRECNRRSALATEDFGNFAELSKGKDKVKVVFDPEESLAGLNPARIGKEYVVLRELEFLQHRCGQCVRILKDQGLLSVSLLDMIIDAANNAYSALEPIADDTKAHDAEKYLLRFHGVRLEQYTWKDDDADLSESEVSDGDSLFSDLTSEEELEKQGGASEEEEDSSSGEEEPEAFKVGAGAIGAVLVTKARAKVLKAKADEVKASGQPNRAELQRASEAYGDYARASKRARWSGE